MHNLKDLRKNLDNYKKKFNDRNVDFDINNFEKNCEKRHDPFEKYINEILQKEIAISPIKSLAIHLTNMNSSYGLSPFINYKKLWEENETDQ